MKHLLNRFLALLFCLSAFTAFSQNADSAVQANKGLILRADSLIADYQFEKALRVLMEGDSLRKDVLMRIGLCNLRLGASSAAIHPYERVLQIDSTDRNALNNLGQLYSRDGDYQKALDSFLRLIKIDSSNSYYCKQAGSMAMKAEKMETAMYWFRKALNLNPSDTEASLALGNVLMELEEYQSVDSVVDQALSVDPGSKALMQLRARSAFEQQHYEAVVITVNHLLEKSDTTSLYARYLGVSYFNLKEHSKVLTCMNFLLRNRNDNEWIYYYSGIATRELGDAAGSIPWFKLAVQKSISENTRVYYSQLGQSFEETGDYQEAINAYKAAYSYSKEGILLFHLARNYDAFYKDKSTALTYYRKYLASDDTIRRAKEYAKKRMQDLGDF